MEIEEQGHKIASLLEDTDPKITNPSEPIDIAKNVEAIDKTPAQVDPSPDLDPYYYSKRDEFTSELFKIEIGGLPRKLGLGLYSHLRKLLKNKLELDCHKIKGSKQNSSWAFVTFGSEKEREKALTVVNGYKWKGHVLTAKRANPAADPLVRKRQALSVLECEDAKKFKGDDESDLPMEDRINLVVCPLWRTPYQDQLQLKQTEVARFLVIMARKLQTIVDNRAQGWLTDNKSKHSGQCCVLNPIRPTPSRPVEDGSSQGPNAYRNKCEFTVGLGPTGEWTVGFRFTRYSVGSMTVGEVNSCPTVSDEMKRVVCAFQEYVRSSGKPPFNPNSHEGYWRQLTVRTSCNGHVMVTVIIHPQKMELDELEELKGSLKEYFENGNGKQCGITSLFFQTFSQRKSGGDPPLHHIFGEQHMMESILGLNFRVSPSAFLQVNSAGAEELYKLIAELVGTSEDTTILDLCCGTGTIGLTLAKGVGHVIGIEVVPEAVADANHNTELNGIKNAEFVCGRAEDVLNELLPKKRNRRIVAVIDPPRAGLHNKALRAIRSCREIDNLIFVSCDPSGAMSNFVDLCRPTSNQYRLEPFRPISATAVDMFPHTNHYELVFLFQREKLADLDAKMQD